MKQLEKHENMEKQEIREKRGKQGNPEKQEKNDVGDDDGDADGDGDYDDAPRFYQCSCHLRCIYIYYLRSNGKESIVTCYDNIA